jgi:hypothetical protein
VNYWLVCLPREDLLHCIDIGVFGLGRRQTISNVHKGDLVGFLVTKEKPWKLVSVGRATSDYYVDDKNVFKKPGSFVDRFNFTATLLNPEVPFSEIIGKLSFISKPEYWPAYFKTGIVKLSAADWDAIESATTRPIHPG